MKARVRRRLGADMTTAATEPKKREDSTGEKHAGSAFFSERSSTVPSGLFTVTREFAWSKG